LSTAFEERLLMRSIEGYTERYREKDAQKDRLTNKLERREEKPHIYLKMSVTVKLCTSLRIALWEAIIQRQTERRRGGEMDRNKHEK
jgi:hypothetical protein